MKLAIFLGVLTAVTTGCKDRAEAPLQECINADNAQQWTTAIQACEYAVSVSPDTKNGKAAAMLITVIKGRIADAKAKAEAEAGRAAEVREVERTMHFKPATPNTFDAIDEYRTKCSKLGKPANFMTCLPVDTHDNFRSSVSFDQQTALCTRLAEAKSCVSTYDNPKNPMYCCP